MKVARVVSDFRQPFVLFTNPKRKSLALFFSFFHRPFPTLVWKKNGVVLESGKDFIEIPKEFKGRLLNITRVMENMHETTFTCEASNNQTIAPKEYVIRLDVEGKP